MAETPVNPESNNPVDNKAKDDVVNKKRKYKEVAAYGNYRNYYGYRVGNDVEEDPRFKVLKKEWFEGKDCLDIGCNSALITINIAKKFECRTILGIDIDENRVNDAKWKLKKFVGKTMNDPTVASKSKVANCSNELDCAETCSTSPDSVKNSSCSMERNLLDVVSFQCDNFVSSWCQLPLKYYDTIVCLSVTKWVHLNWGDGGLITLFTKIWKLLHPGGIFVMEPQPWDSYYKNRLTTETTQLNYQSISLRPHDFQEILLDKIGFRTVEQATSRISGATVGFDRPVLVFRK